MSALTVPAAVPLRDDLVACLYRFLKISLVGIGGLIGLWLISSMLAPGNNATPMLAPTSTNAGSSIRTATVTLVAGSRHTTDRSSSRKNSTKSSAGIANKARAAGDPGASNRISRTSTANLASTAAARPHGKAPRTKRYGNGVTCQGNCQGDRNQLGDLTVTCKGTCDIRHGKRTRVFSKGMGKGSRAELKVVTLFNGAETDAQCAGDCGTRYKTKGGKVVSGRTAGRGKVEQLVHSRGLGVDTELRGRGIVRGAYGLTARGDSARSVAEINKNPYVPGEASTHVEGSGVVSAGRGYTARAVDSDSSASIRREGRRQSVHVIGAGNLHVPGVGSGVVRHGIRSEPGVSSVYLQHAGPSRPAEGSIQGNGSLTIHGKTVRGNGHTYADDEKTLKANPRKK